MYTVYIVYTGLILLSLLCLTNMCLTFMAAWLLLDVRVRAVVRPNDDDATVKTFLDLLEKAKRSMVIYDDGDKVAGSIYDNDDVLAKVAAKLKKSPAFKIQCCFDCDDATLGFRERFEGNSQVSIETLGYAKEDRPDDVHYKIIDDGQKACLSRHDLGSEERRFKVIDCTRVRPKFVVNRLVVQATLGEYLEDFKEKFAHARLASTSNA